MKKTKTIAAVIISAFFLAQACNKPGMDVETSIEVPVGVIEVETSSLEEFIHTTGTVYPIEEVSLHTEMAGEYRLQINPATGKTYALGDGVKKGATLIRLEDEEYYNNLRIKSREVDLEISQQEYDKQKSLYEKGGATLRELKNSEIALINSRYEMESARINLAKMSITAPFTGVISRLPYFTQGTRINANTLVASVINYSRLYLEANLPEKHFNNVSRGFKVYVTSYTSTEDTLVGEITQISPAIDPEARTFTCVINVDNPNQTILPGMFVRADLVINSADSTMVIPKDIIVSRNRQHIVYVVDKGIANERRIMTGLEGPERIEVLSGLEPGETVVSKGFETLRDKSKVKVLR